MGSFQGHRLTVLPMITRLSVFTTTWMSHFSFLGKFILNSFNLCSSSVSIYTYVKIMILLCQLVWSFAPGSPIGTWICWDFLEQTLSPLVWFWWRPPQMAPKTCLYKHHRLPFYVSPSCCILLIVCYMPSNWKIHHTNGNFLYLPFSNLTWISLV